MAAGDLTTLAQVKAWLNQGQVTESAVVPDTPGPYVVTVARAAAWNGDAGVILAVGGAALTPVSGTPGPGEYHAAAGVYTFNAAQKTLGVSITYTTVLPGDPLLARLITAASAFIQNQIGYQVASQAYDLVLDGPGGNRLAFGRPPLTAVASLKINGVAIPLAANMLQPGYRLANNTLVLQGYYFTRGSGNVELSCTRGYASVPPDLEQAAIELLAVRFKERDHIGQVSANMAGQNVTFSAKDMPDSVKTAVKNWKKVVPL